jgi:hypothetical protein
MATFTQQGQEEATKLGYASPDALETEALNADGANQNITSDQLAPNTPTNLPPTPTYDNSKVEGNVNDFTAKNTTDSEIEKLKADSAKDATGVSDLLKDIGLTSAQEGSFVEQEGGYEAKKQYDEYSSQLEQEQLRYRREADRIREQNPGGMLSSGLNYSLQELERKSLSKQADIAILGNAAARRYDTAVAIAKNKVEMLLAPKKAELEGLKYIQENNKAFQTAEFSNLLSRKTTEYNKELENKEKSEIMIVNALQGKAPQTLIDNAKKIIEQGGTYTEVAAALGNYSMSQADRLDLKLKQAQLDKIYADTTAESAADKKTRLALESEKKAKIPQLKGKIDLIQKIANSPALKYMVGPTGLARDKGIFGTPDLGAVGSRITGETQAFLGSVNQLVNKEFLDAITALKAQGGTLGALSEQEGAKLGAAATKINDWAVHKDGDVNKPIIGYNVSEEEFLTELSTILSSTQTIYEELGGIIPGSAREQELIDGFLGSVDETLLNSDNLYSEAGYN